MRQKLRSWFFIAASLVFVTSVGYCYLFAPPEPPMHNPKIVTKSKDQMIKISEAAFPDCLIRENNSGHIEIVHPCVVLWENMGNSYDRTEYKIILVKNTEEDDISGDIPGWHFYGDLKMIKILANALYPFCPNVWEKYRHVY